MSSVDPNQQKILMFMPFLMVIISFKMPAGVLLYWAISQIISSGQQILIMNQGKEAKNDI
jgi:YidC/Oxa1 family membrane protein insertase